MGAPSQFEARQRGFTLIELMVVVIIVGVLAAVALPAYQDSVIKSNRGAAQAYLLELAQKQQLYFNDTRTYAADVTDLKEIPTKVANNYTLSITLSTVTPPPEFTITAAPKAGTAQVKDGSLTIDDKGKKLRAGSAW